MTPGLDSSGFGYLAVVGSTGLLSKENHSFARQGICCLFSSEQTWPSLLGPRALLLATDSCPPHLDFSILLLVGFWAFTIHLCLVLLAELFKKDKSPCPW